MLEDQVAFLLQKYLGNYVRGLNKEALKISVWRAEPATQVEGCSEDAVQEAKRSRVREMEIKLLERQQQLKSELNSSWLGSFISTVIGNIKLSIGNIHIRYEDVESNPGHPFAAGLVLSKLSAVTVDDLGKETFATGGDLDRVKKSVELESLAMYFNSDSSPWTVDKPWEDLVPSEWTQDGYRDILKMADNFSSFNQRLRYAHLGPSLPVKSDPRAWWKYAYKVVTQEIKKSSGSLSWEQLLRNARLRKTYVSLYASLLKSDMSRLVVDDHDEIKRLDRELDMEVILQWRMLAHKFVEQSAETYQTGSSKDEEDSKSFTDEDWERLNRIIGYKENNEYIPDQQDMKLMQFDFEIRMKHNASKLTIDDSEFLADLSCQDFCCNLKMYPEAKIFDLKLGSYRLLSPYGLLAESANVGDSFVGIFSYKPFDEQLDWSLTAKASPCYITYLKDSIDQIVGFFKSSPTISQNLALETAAAVQMTLDEMKRTAQQQMTRVLKDQSRFSLNMDIAAPKITVPTKFRPDDVHETKLLLDLGNLVLRTEEIWDSYSSEEQDIYLNFNLVLSDVSAFLVDGDYHWNETSDGINLLPVIDKCGIALKLQQILEDTGALILLFDNDEGRKIWQSRLQGAIYRASGSAALSSFPEVALSSETNSFKGNFPDVDTEKLFVAGILDELKICFSCGYESNHKLKKILLAKESSLFEFRAVGGQVVVNIATLTFFCHRPTVIAIMEFMNAINLANGADTGKDKDAYPVTVRDEAQILLMNESGDRLATLSQNNLSTDVKVFTSSFSIKAALGNLKISDDSLRSNHPYFWVCDMRNPGGRSFVEIDFTSYNAGDEDYCGYDYSLAGQLSEVRIVYLNRFVQEIITYFMGLVPKSSDGVVKLKDDVTNSEKWWIGGDKNEMSAVHLDILTVTVKDINLVIGMDMVRGETIIQDVEGLSFELRRSLRDLWHQLPAVEAAIKVDVLKAALSNREYEIISECALSNFAETPHPVPALDDPQYGTSTTPSHASASSSSERSRRDSPLASVQASGAWLLYKSNTRGESFLYATLKGFSVFDDREGTKDELRLAIGKSATVRDTSSVDVYVNPNELDSASENDSVYLIREDDGFLSSPSEEIAEDPVKNASADMMTEFIMELQAIGPELTFYSTSRNAGENLALSTKVIHARTDAYCRLIMKGGSMEMNGNILGLKMESNGIRVIEPFDMDNGNMIFWRADNAFGSFLPGDPASMSMHGKAYDLRHMLFDGADSSSKTISRRQNSRNDASQLQRSALTSGMFYFGDIAVNGYEPPNSAVVLRDTGEDTFLRAPEGYDLVGRIKKHRGTEGISFWFPKAPSGFVALGCIASKSSPEKEDFSLLRCIRSDMVTGGQFSEESVWDSSNARTSEPFSLWTVDNDAGTFLVRSGYRKPPKRLALKLAGPPTSSSSDSINIDAEIKTFSAVSFDDYGGMMVPLFGMSFDSVGLSYHGGSHHLNATIKVDEGLATGEYMTAVRLLSENSSVSDAQQQSARTCAAAGEHSSQNIRKVNWNEMFFFKVESEEPILISHPTQAPSKFINLRSSLSERIVQILLEQSSDNDYLMARDGAVDLSAYDDDGKCMHILLCSKPSSFQAVPTKVINVRPYMTFTNRIGQDLYIKLSVEDEPKVLHAYDWRVSFMYSEGDTDKLQVQLVDTDWCQPLEIVKEDTIIIAMRKQDGSQKFVKAEIRGYEEGSRFLIVFRLGPAYGPIRIENRTSSTTISTRQSSLGEDSWIQVKPLSTRKYSWDDPYGQKAIDVSIQKGDVTSVLCVDLENPIGSYTSFREHGLNFSIIETGDIKIWKFTDYLRKEEVYGLPGSEFIDDQALALKENEIETDTSPLELIVELGVVGISLIDHKPRELLYLHLQKVFISYMTGYDSGTTSRFKLILGQLQLDNQLPLSTMPVVLATESRPDSNRPVFKANIAVSNVTSNGIQVYPHVYIRVIDETWRLNIHEPIIWALVDFYNNLRFVSGSSSTTVTEVDPEIRIELVDISEIRLKISLETAPTQRPRGVLGIWSPVLSAVGNAFKIQVWSRRITGVGDGLVQGTEAFAQGLAFGVSGVLRKPVESARQYGLVGIAPGLGRAFVPSGQRHVYFASDDDKRESHSLSRSLISSRGTSSDVEQRFTNDTVNFEKMWSSEPEIRSRCKLVAKQVADDGRVFSIWRPLCPNGYVSIGDVAHVGTHAPHCAAVYKNDNGNFALPLGYDLVWRNCAEDYKSPVSIWLPRPPGGYVALGCIAVPAFEEPPLDSAFCVDERLTEDAEYEEQIIWASSDAYPWGCYVYQVQSNSLQFMALRVPKEQSELRPKKILESIVQRPSTTPRQEKQTCRG
nr:unnamed protein product [Digitaria exilis]